MKPCRETEAVLNWLRARGACDRATSWIQANVHCSLEQLYNAVERYDFLRFLLVSLHYDQHANHLNRVIQQHAMSGFWLQQEYRRLVNRQLCDNVRYRLPYAKIREQLFIRGVLK